MKDYEKKIMLDHMENVLQLRVDLAKRRGKFLEASDLLIEKAVKMKELHDLANL